MARNVEIKARLTDPRAVEARAREVADQGPFELVQDDTFFACPSGRLKLRELAPDRGQLIFYQRADTAGPKLSSYFIAPTQDPAALRETLGRALRVIGRVRKRRRLYLAGQTRIHLDQVEGLGSFLELEVALADTDDTTAGEQVAMQLMNRLGVPAGDLVKGAYLDLMGAQPPI
ncbi:MAG TPA: class IV adenylate cyclase [Gammaproteobacteria bacterium]